MCFDDTIHVELLDQIKFGKFDNQKSDFFVTFFYTKFVRRQHLHHKEIEAVVNMNTDREREREREREIESSRGRRLQSLHQRVKAPWWKKVEADNHVLLLATNSTSLMPWGWTEHISTVHAETTIYTSTDQIATHSYRLHFGDIFVLTKLLKVNYSKCL